MTQDRIRLSNVAQLVPLVPTLVTFHPVDSVVIVAIADGRVAVTARVDMDECPPIELPALMDRVANAVHAETLVCFTFTTEARRLEASASLAAMALATEGGLFFGGMVEGDQFREWGEPEWQPVDWTSSAVVQATAYGLAKRTTRSEWGAVFDKEPEGVTPHTINMARRLWPQMISDVIETQLITDKQLSHLDARLLAGLVQDEATMERALLKLNKANGEFMLNMWTRVFRFCTPEEEPVLIGIIGMAAWVSQAGGPLATMSLELLDARPDGHIWLRDILDTIHTRAMNPSAWEGFLSGLRAKEINDAL